jgi:hypothetical protein
MPGIPGGGGGFGGMQLPPDFDPDRMATMMQNPMFMTMMEQMMSDPAMLDQMIQSNPMVRDNPAAQVGNGISLLFSFFDSLTVFLGVRAGVSVSE